MQKYVTTMYIPTTRPNKNRSIFSKKCALEQLEEIKKRYNVVDSKWIDEDLVIKIEVEL